MGYMPIWCGAWLPPRNRVSSSLTCPSLQINMALIQKWHMGAPCKREAWSSILHRASRLTQRLLPSFTRRLRGFEYFWDDKCLPLHYNLWIFLDSSLGESTWPLTKRESFEYSTGSVTNKYALVAQRILQGSTKPKNEGSNPSERTHCGLVYVGKTSGSEPEKRGSSPCPTAT